MKKLNITKERFEKSRYFTKKYGKLEYVSESGRFFKTDKGRVLTFKESSMDDDDESKVMVDLRLFAQGDQWGAIAELEDGTEVPVWAVNGNDPDEIPPWETSEAEYERWYNLALDEAHDQGFVLEGELG